MIVRGWLCRQLQFRKQMMFWVSLSLLIWGANCSPSSNQEALHPERGGGSPTAKPILVTRWYWLPLQKDWEVRCSDASCIIKKAGQWTILIAWLPSNVPVQRLLQDAQEGITLRSKWRTLHRWEGVYVFQGERCPARYFRQLSLDGSHWTVVAFVAHWSNNTFGVTIFAKDGLEARKQDIDQVLSALQWHKMNYKIKK
jgi:hypothetical protein